MSESCRTRDARRFSTKIDRNEHGCWNWTGCTNQSGYGAFRVSRPTRKTVLAHRFAYEMARGEIPPGLFVCHHCDNPKCCNPDHLYLGDQTRNMRDASERGRMPVGEAHHATTLTEIEARFIKIWLAHGFPQRLIAETFQTSQTTVWNINRGASWSRVSC